MVREEVMDCKNKVFKTNNFGELIITNYVKYKEVYVKFLATGYETKTTMSRIEKGQVKDKLLPNVCGIGITGDELTKTNGKHLKEYALWGAMIKRCYDLKFHNKGKTYKDCSVSDNFKFFTFFKKWCNEQIGFNSVDDKGKPFALDKDILVKGSKIYSEHTCVFVPAEINSLLIRCGRARGDLYIGVYFSKKNKKYVSQIRYNSNQIHLGHFDTETEAFYAYKQAKEAYIKEIANKWKDKIDHRVYEALMDYEVSIDD